MDADALIDALGRSTFQVTGVLSRVGNENDLSLTQLRLLGILRDRRVRMSDLAIYLGLDKSTLSGLVDRAERRGLLARERNAQDRRVLDVFATPAGLELAERLFSDVRSALLPAIEKLTPQQAEQLTELLELTLP